MKSKIILIVIVATSLFSCIKKDDPAPPSATNASTKITFQNFVGTKPLVLNTEWYTNANGDSFKVSTYKYYITNIKLAKADGSVYTETESYHLINEAEASTKFFVMGNIPEGNYTSISFLFGVDSTSNTFQTLDGKAYFTTDTQGTFAVEMLADWGATGSLCEILWGVSESAPDTGISTVFTATSGAVFTFQVLPSWPSAGGTAPDAQTVTLSFQVIGVPAENFA